jgi:hypothetical protein
MDEQRILEEMERMLAADDPRLAARLAAFGQPGVNHVLRTRRARAVLSLLMLAVIAVAAAVIYVMSAFHSGPNAPATTPQRTASSQPTRARPAQNKTQLSGSPHCTARLAPGACTALSLPGG